MKRQRQSQAGTRFSEFHEQHERQRRSQVPYNILKEKRTKEISYRREEKEGTPNSVPINETPNSIKEITKLEIN